MNLLKMLFGSRKPAVNKPVVISRFSIRYCVDGNLKLKNDE